MTKRTVFIMMLCFGFVCTLLTQVYAGEAILDPVKDSKLKRLINLSVKDVFQSLKEIDFVYDEEFLEKGIRKAFLNREEQGVQFAIGYVQAGQNTRDAEKSKNFYIAKKILQIFPDESERYLEKLYNNGDPDTRGNVIHVAVRMPSSDLIRSILMKALEDKSFCEEQGPDSVGDPLRVCDVAYNQIVFQYGIRNVLRTIGTVHRIEVRDYHIAKLKNIF